MRQKKGQAKNKKPQDIEVLLKKVNRDWDKVRMDLFSEYMVNKMNPDVGYAA